MRHLDRFKLRMKKEDLEVNTQKIEKMFAEGLTSEQIIAKEKKDKKDKPK